MNYIWYPLIEAIQLGYDTTKIYYRVKDRKFYYDLEDERLCYSGGGHHVSPFLEYMPFVLYDPFTLVKWEEKFAHLDINPFYRFDSIFCHILTPERNDYNDQIVCDIIMHMLAHVDRVCGMSKEDFRIMLLIKDIEMGCFDDEDGAFSLFSVAEKRLAAEALIMLYETSNSLRSIDFLFNSGITNFNVLIRDNGEVVFYNQCQFDKTEDIKLRFIIKLLLPVDYPYVIHWRYTYGTIGFDDSMAIEKFVL